MLLPDRQRLLRLVDDLLVLHRQNVPEGRLQQVQVVFALAQRGIFHHDGRLRARLAAPKPRTNTSNHAVRSGRVLEKNAAGGRGGASVLHAELAATWLEGRVAAAGRGAEKELATAEGWHVSEELLRRG